MVKNLLKDDSVDMTQGFIAPATPRVGLRPKK